jgi:hypothetical protein
MARWLRLLRHGDQLQRLLVVIAEHGTQATAYDINGTARALSDVQLLILGVYDGPTVANIPYTITGCRALMPAAASTAKSLNTGTLGYSQTTQSNLVQVLVLATRASGYYRNLGYISLGPPASDSSLAGSAILTITDADMKDGRRRVTSATNPFALEDVDAPFFIDGGGSTGGVLASKIDEFFTAGAIRVADPNISGGDLVGVNAWWGADPIINDGAITVGLAALTSASNPFVVGDVGQTIVVEGAGAAGAALITTIAAYVGAGQVTLTAVAGTTVTAARVWWRGISVATHAGPTYAYAWYDPETGHMSNIAQMFPMPRPTSIGNFTDFANITPSFRIDPGYIQYPEGASSTTVNTATDGARFSHLVFFRPLSTPGSSTLYPIGSLNPYVGKVHPGSVSTRGSWNPSTYKGWMGLPSNCSDAPPQTPANQNLWYDFSSDSDLLLAGGFRAPQFTNEKPMALLRGGATQPGYPYLLAYWDRRLWIINTQEPSKVMFSCDEAQCPLGVPEESFPPQNFLRLPSAADGKGIGMKAVGDMLIITTQRFAYIVAGNNESNYRLMKISSSMPGVGTYQMSEFPTATGAEGEPTTLFFLGRDRIVYQWTVGRSVVPISTPIQDQLDTLIQPYLSFYTGARVHCISAWGRRLVAVAPFYNTGQGGGLPTFIYDIDAQVWSRAIRGDGAANFATFFSGTAPMTTVYGANNVPVDEIYGIYTSNPISGVHAMSWIRDDGANCTYPMEIDTFPMALDGKKTRKQIVSVNIHATSGTWTGKVYVNDQSSSSFTFATYPDPITSIYAPTGTQGVLDDVQAQDLVCMAGQFTADGTPLVGYRFTVVVQKNVDNNAAQLYAVDVGYIDVENPGDGDA